MPFYYFHVVDDIDAKDQEGADLPSLEEAIEHARRSARSMMADTLQSESRITLYHRIDIEDEDGSVLATVPFGDALRIET